MMHFSRVGERRYAQFERLRHEAGLAHAFSTRPADMSPRDGPDAADRAARRRQMAADLGLDAMRLASCQQVHRGELTVADGPRADELLPACDGVVTSLPGVPVMSFSADCPLVLVYDPVRRVVGLAHASWRCTVTQIARRLVELMAGRCGSRAAELLAGIGPGAGPCCYEVQRDVYDAAAALPNRDRLFQTRDGRLYFDLWAASRDQLLAAGVPADRIEVAGVCTMCTSDVFYSYRREGAGCGHFGLIAGLT
jgi:YfiH family protein